MRKRKGTSLADVAKATGVTTATVSRVLNNRYEGFSVRPELRTRILQVAKDLSYRPDLMAQSLRKTQMGIVGLLGAHLPLVIPEYTLRGLVTLLEKRNIKLTTYFADDLSASFDLPPWRIDAAVLSGVLSPADVAPVEKSGMPYVSLNGYCGPNGISVEFDDVEGTRQVMEHLFSLGHERIAYANIGGPWAAHASVGLRHQTYLTCLRERGLRPMPLHDEPTEAPANAFVKTVVDAGATAILAYHHFNAVYVMQAAAQLGICVPDDLSIAAFNDEYPLQFLNPGVTAVAMPAVEAGEAAAESLIKQIHQGRCEGKKILLRETLVVRGSTVRPRTGKPGEGRTSLRPLHA